MALNILGAANAKAGFPRPSHILPYFFLAAFFLATFFFAFFFAAMIVSLKVNLGIV
ncbi:MAG: hypothetical protein ACK59Y_10475 [Betaproteobacteria bacterium]